MMAPELLLSKLFFTMSILSIEKYLLQSTRHNGRSNATSEKKNKCIGWEILEMGVMLTLMAVFKQ